MTKAAKTKSNHLLWLALGLTEADGVERRHRILSNVLLPPRNLGNLCGGRVGRTG
jgi:hypothetical protein